jgi:hypothetical protein
LSIFQPFALLWAIDYFLPPFFSEAHNVALIGITVLGGLIAVAAGPAVPPAHQQNSQFGPLRPECCFTAVNALVFRFPLLPVHRTGIPDVRADAVAMDRSFPYRQCSHRGGIALSIIIFWLTWLEMGEVERKQGMNGASTRIHFIDRRYLLLLPVWSCWGTVKYIGSGAAVRQRESAGCRHCLITAVIGRRVDGLVRRDDRVGRDALRVPAVSAVQRDRCRSRRNRRWRTNLRSSSP